MPSRQARQSAAGIILDSRNNNGAAKRRFGMGNILENRHIGLVRRRLHFPQVGATNLEYKMLPTYRCHASNVIHQIYQAMINES